MPENMGFLQVPYFLFLLFPVVYSKGSSPIPTCGNNSFYIQYPFHSLEEGQKPHSVNGHPEFNIKCTASGIAVLNLSPSSGEFYVRDIDYFEQQIELEDPRKCLPRRLMNLNLPSDSPFRALLYQNYTFLKCPHGRLAGAEFRGIECLSNTTVSMFATSSKLRVEEMKSNGCHTVITDLPIPVTSFDQYEFNGFDGNLVLEWQVSVCQRCTGKSGSKSISKTILLALLIASIVALVTMLSVGSCLVCIIGLKFEVTHNEASESSQDLSTLRPEMVQMPIAATRNECRIQIYQPEELVVGESRRIAGPNSEACPICLEDYRPMEILQHVEGCDHCFHEHCLNRWLFSESTCPVCRTSVSS